MTLQEAEAQLLDAIARGEVQAFGRRNGYGDKIPIPREAAIGAKLATLDSRFGTPRLHIVPYDREQLTAVRWYEVHVAREDVLRLWLEPREQATAEPAASGQRATG